MGLTTNCGLEKTTAPETAPEAAPAPAPEVAPAAEPAPAASVEQAAAPATPAAPAAPAKQMVAIPEAAPIGDIKVGFGSVVLANARSPSLSSTSPTLRVSLTR